MWDFGLVLFNSPIRMQFLKKFWFWQYFLFSRGKLGPKMD